ncbi:unnamed protein product [Spirodela intermedia]|uniref:Uncharacterized protein n=1 Tax=Spirodela intermedia TaxID=51605 RepID=A0A7I8JYZ5_SPIIN|nr:unnamed protein product [Spirodela intermedia]
MMHPSIILKHTQWCLMFNVWIFNDLLYS